VAVATEMGSDRDLPSPVASTRDLVDHPAAIQFLYEAAEEPGENPVGGG
jgi:hypothetical protein